MERSTRPLILLAVFGVVLAVTESASAQPSSEQIAAREVARKQALARAHSSPVTIVDGTPRPLPGLVTGPADDPAPATARGREPAAQRREPTSLTTVTDEAGMAVPLGGDDVVVAASADFSGSAYLQILSDGTYVGSVAALGDVYVYKSADKGETWTLWSTFSDPIGFVSSLPEVTVAEGTADRILFAYPSAGQVRLAYADVYAPVPAWTIVTALTGAGIFHGNANRIDIATDAASFADYYVYLVAQSDDSNGDDIWFTRSLDMGSSFQPAYRIADSAVGSYDSYAAPTICFGAANYLHVAYISEVTSPSELDDASYRRVPMWADGGVGSWEAPQTIYAQSGTDRAVPIRISAGITHGGVYLHMLRFGPLFGYFRYSTDFGASWPPSSNASSNIPAGGGTAPLETPAGELLLAGTFQIFPDPNINISIGRSTVAAPSIWTVPQSCSSHAWLGSPTYARIEGLATDPAFGNRWALLWVQSTTPQKRLRFDAEWRRDPGYPNTDIGFPIAVAGGGQTPPAVAEVDGDAQKEIVFGTISGDIHVLNHNGTPVPGWPVNVGGLPIDAPVAVGDLHGDGVSVVAGGTNGFVHAFDREGNPLDGWPVDLGTGTEVFVSIGDLGPPSLRYVVALSARKVAIINFQGTNVAPVWIPPEIPFGTYRRPAAIGDVDANGVVDIVSLAGPNVYYHQLGVPGYTGNQYPGEIFSDAPTLADIDEDGDLEVAMPTFSGKMYIENPGDLVPFPGWPVTVGVPLTSAAMAQFLGPNETELVFGDANGNVHLYWFDGIAQTGFPKASGSAAFYTQPIVTPVSSSVSNIAVGTTAAGTGTSRSWSNFGTVPAGWPKNLPGPVEMTFASGDIDNDGRNEIVVLGVDFLTVLDVGTAPASVLRDHWPMYGHDAQRTGCLCEETIVAVSDTPSGARVNAIESHPNPFNPIATIEYDVARAGNVSLEIFDVSGRHVATLVDDEPRDAGHYSVTYRATGASGVYFARLRTVDGDVTTKIVLLK